MKKLLFISIFIFSFLFASEAEAAVKYARTAGGNWNADATWSTTSGGAADTVAPTAADDIILDSNSGNVTITAAAVARSLDMTSGTGNYANTLNHDAGFTLSIGDGTAGAGNVALKFVASKYTIDNALTSAIAFVSTNTTQQSITWAGNTHGNLTFNGAGGSWILNDASTSVGAATTVTSGTFHTGDQTCSWGSFVSTGSVTRVITLGSSSIGVSINGTAWTMANGTNVTLNASTSTITLTGNATNFFTASAVTARDYNNVVLSGGTSANIDGSSPTFVNLTRTGTAARLDTLRIQANNGITISGTFTINGNSSVNRVLLQSSAVGAARTITSANNSFSNVDIQDITGAGAASWNLSAITGLSGDAGGNTNITFTSAATQYWVGRTGNWSTAAEWGTSSGGSGGRVPLPQDDVVFDANSFNGGSQSVTTDMPRLGKNITWAGDGAGAVTNTPLWSKAITGGTLTVYGSVTMVPGMTQNGNQTLLFEGRGAFTLTSAGLGLSNPVTIQMFGGSLELQDAFSSAGFVLNNGTFDANDFSVTLTSFNSNVSTTRALIMGNGTWTATSQPNFWVVSSTLSLTPNASTIVSTNTGVKTFTGGGLTYNNLTFSGTGTATTTIAGSNTFNEFKDIGSAAHVLQFTSGTTQTMAIFTVSGSSGNVITLAETSGTNPILSDSSGNNCSDYLSISNITAQGGAGWYAGANSTDGGGNTGWTFSACSAAGGGNNSTIIFFDE